MFKKYSLNSVQKYTTQIAHLNRIKSSEVQHQSQFARELQSDKIHPYIVPYFIFVNFS